MLDVSNLNRSYGNFKAVEDVNFSVGSGEIIGLLGHNGAGKTTVMKMLTGCLEPDSGNVMINGHSTDKHLKKVQRDIGYLPENLLVYPEMSVADYLDYAAELKGIRKQNRGSEIARVIEATDLGVKIVDPIATLSRGYKQRVGVAQAILGKPSLLILDEPTNGLDPTQTEQMRQLLRGIAEDATVMLSTHIMQEVEALCDRVLMMRSGKLVLDESISSIRSSNQLSLETSHDQENIERLTAEIDGVHLSQPQQSVSSDHYVYAFAIDDTADFNRVSAAISRAVLTSGGELYAISRTQRDLESLFKQVTTENTEAGEVVSNAA